MADLNSFIGLYPVSKTLRFELIPQGKTFEHIKNNGFLDRDEHRAESYLLVKKIIDEYHKSFISRALEGLVLIGIDDYVRYFDIQTRSEEEKKKFEEVQVKLRKQIVEQFSKHEDYKNLFAKELIREVLKGFVKTDEELELVKEFDSFTTYFTGFHENRKNIYSDEEKATAIAYRLIHENLPRFLDNVRSFKKVLESPVREKFNNLLGDSQLGPIVQISSVEEMFHPDFFNETLTQTGIDQYNHLIGGYVPLEGQEKIKGLNEYINLHNQTAKKEERLPKLKPLYKQILSDRMTVSYIPEQFTKDDELLETIENFYQDINAQVINKHVKGENSLKSLLQNITNFDLSGIFLRNDLGLTDISQKAFGDWSTIQNGVNCWFDMNYQGKARKGTEKYLEEQKKYSRNRDSFSIGFLDECLKLQNGTACIGIGDYFALLGKIADVGNLFERIETNYKSVVDLLNNPYPLDKNLAQDKNSVEELKMFLDSLKELQRFIKPLLGNGDEAGKDERFYGEFSAHWNTLDTVTPLYSKVRNYLTRKPYSTEKMKLNFENSTLLDGWDVNKESDNTSLIFRRGDLFYLGIMDRKHNRIFKGKIDHDGGPSYEKMEYKLLLVHNKQVEINS